jgi:hypothetical protein
MLGVRYSSSITAHYETLGESLPFRTVDSKPLLMDRWFVIPRRGGTCLESGHWEESPLI